jgi:UPF0755 protein
VFRTLKWLLLAAIAAAVLLAALAAWWLQRPLPLAPQAQGVVDVVIEPGTSARGVARVLVQSGLQTSPELLFLWFRVSGQGHRLQAGTYEFGADTSPRELLRKLVAGEQALRRITLLEGWTYHQVLQALRQADALVYDLPAQASPTELMRFLGLPHNHPEGRFFPDTYVYPKNSKASALLRQAAQAMDRQLAQAWEQRHPNLPLRNPDEALILASIIERETGLPSDRPMVSGVFNNRLRIGMRLQADPTVVYGLGPGFDERLRRIHLQTDTPWNTYTRAGLPPTPIAMPGMASLLAAVQPADTQAMYFVARGDGSSAFSRTYAEHNVAIRRYILNQ